MTCRSPCRLTGRVRHVFGVESFQLKVGLVAVVPAQPGGEAGGNEQWMTEPAFQGSVLLDRSNDRSVEADAGVEAEEASVDAPEADGTKVASINAACQQVCGGDRIVRHAERAREDVRGTAWKHAERRVGASDSGCHLVQRAVAAVANDHVDTATGCVVSEAGGVTAAIRFDHLDFVTLRETSVYDHRVACRDRRRKRVDDQQDSQAADGTHRIVARK